MCAVWVSRSGIIAPAGSFKSDKIKLKLIASLKRRSAFTLIELLLLKTLISDLEGTKMDWIGRRNPAFMRLNFRRRGR